MENLVKTFESQKFGKVRVIEENGKLMFAGVDVANILGYARAADAITQHCKGSVKRRVPTNGGTQEIKMITEGDLYRLIARSKLPKAQEFETWVFDEVIPSIRKHGAYMTPEKIEEVLMNPEFIIKLATELKEEKQKVAQLQPKADFYDTVASSESLLSMADVAKVLDKGIGRNRLFKLLRSRGILQSNNVPYQRFVDAGYFKVVESSYMAGDNAIVSTVTYVKQKGVDYIRKLLEESK